MNSATAVKERVGVQVSTKSEFDKVTFIALSAVAVAFGIFAFASMAGAVASVGVSGMVKGWLVAVGLV